jgi:hypothetical protein
MLRCINIDPRWALFNEVDPSVEKYKNTYGKEFIPVMHMYKESVVKDMKTWLESIM